MSAAPGGGVFSKLAPRAIYECAEYGYSLPASWRLARAAARFRPDVLYERYNLHFRAGSDLKRRTGLPFILEVNAPLAEERARHGGLALRQFAKKSEGAIWRSADCVVCVSEVLAETISNAGVLQDRIVVMHNGVDQSFLADVDGANLREKYGLKDKLVLGFAGFIRPWHGVDRVLQVLAESTDPSIHLLLVGDGPAAPDILSAAHELGVGDRVTLTGAVQREAVPAHIAAFDIALQPGVAPYASPLKIFEYMALGKPILAPDSANIREILHDGETALLFDPSAPQALITALEMLIADTDLRRRLGLAARQALIQRDYTWDGNARRVEAIATRLLKERR